MLPIDSTLAASSAKVSHSSPPYTLRCRPSRNASNVVLITHQQQDNKCGGGRTSDDATNVSTTSMHVHSGSGNNNHRAAGVTTLSTNSNDNPGGGNGSHSATSFRNKMPSISIIPLPVSTAPTTITSCSGTTTSTSVVRTVTTSNKATSPPPLFNSPPRSNSSGSSVGLQQQRPLLQHQYQQTDKCTILKFDVVRKPGVAVTSVEQLSRNVIATGPKTQATATATVTSGMTFSATAVASRQQQLQALQQSIFDHEMSDDAEADAEIAALHQQVLSGNNTSSLATGSQPIIVKIEPAQSFHIVDESDTRVLSLPLSDADKVGASWIDLKDIAGLQTTSATLVDVCFDSPPGLLPVSTNTSTSTAEAVVQAVVDSGGISHTQVAKKRQLVVKQVSVEQAATAATISETVITPATAATATATATTSTASGTVTVTRFNANERSVQQQQQSQQQSQQLQQQQKQQQQLQQQQQQLQNKSAATTGTALTPSSSTGLNVGGAMTGWCYSR